MEINPQIKEILQENDIPPGLGTLVLLCYYFNIMPEEEIPDEVHAEIKMTKIVERDYEGGILKWHVPLFIGLGETENVDKEWDWIIEWRKLFGAVRADAIGSRADCYKKMKKYFSEHPSVRVEDVIQATKMYLLTVKDPRYLQKADYFISKTVEGSKGSRLDMYLEILKDSSKTVDVVAQRNLNQIVN